ncbi:MAG: phosphotransacetylase family protein [Actinomycetota bacterium]|nr:phosphotransacetylase family protein [Actinomycetota bacterium]
MVSLYLISAAGLSGMHTVCIGLAMRMREEGLRVGYMKPLGYRYFQQEGKVTDEDAAFMRRTLELEDDLDDLCPVLLSPELVRSALKGERETEALRSRILEAHGRVSAGRDVVIIQGAFTSVQGRFLDLSAYQIAPLLGAKVLLVERFDDALMGDNVMAVRDDFGSGLIGVVFNMVAPNRESFVRELLAPRLEAEGIAVLGSLPRDRLLRSINVGDLAQQLGGRVLTGEQGLDELVEDVVVGAMGTEHALSIFRRHHNFCVVTGGDRSDIQLAAMEAGARCVVLSGNLYPTSIILSRAEELSVPVVLVGEDTFTAADRAEAIIRSARTHEPAKLERLRGLIEEHVDLARLYELAGIAAG